MFNLSPPKSGAMFGKAGRFDFKTRPRSFTQPGAAIPGSELVVSAKARNCGAWPKNNGLGEGLARKLAPWRNTRAWRSRPDQLFRSALLSNSTNQFRKLLRDRRPQF